MTLHIVHHFGPISATSASSIRNLFLSTLNLRENIPTQFQLHLSTEGGNMTAGFALYNFLKSLPIPLTTHNIGSVESIGVVIFLAGGRRFACRHSRFLLHPLHWGFGDARSADHSRLNEWRECLDFDAERYAQIFNEATQGASQPEDVRSKLAGSAQILSAAAAVQAGIIEKIAEPVSPLTHGAATHWWTT